MAENKNIPLEKLIFDVENPRLPRRLQGEDDESIIIDYMIKYGNMIELMKSITETGYFEAEPLLVIPNPDKKYIVIEGNRRLAALKLINNPEIGKVRTQSIFDVVQEAKYKPNVIPVILYKRREDVLDYLGYRHITGVKDWGALEKARYLAQLYEVHIKNTPKDRIYIKLAKMIGSKANYVAKLYLALQLYNLANEEAYFGADISEKDIKFSLLTTALGYEEIIEYLGLKDSDNDSIENVNLENYKNIFTWLFDPDKKKISDSRQISKLADIVNTPEAVKKLENGHTVEEAILYTDMPEKVFLTMLTQSKKSLQQAKDAIEQLSVKPEGASELLEDIQKLVRTIDGGLNANFLASSIIEDNEIGIDELKTMLLGIMKNNK